MLSKTLYYILQKVVMNPIKKGVNRRFSLNESTNEIHDNISEKCYPLNPTNEIKDRKKNEKKQLCDVLKIDNESKRRKLHSFDVVDGKTCFVFHGTKSTNCPVSMHWKKKRKKCEFDEYGKE